MLENGKISARQFTVLVILYTIGSAIVVVPSAVASFAKQDAWIAGIIGVGVGLLLIWLYNAVGNLFPHMTLIKLNEKLLGKWVGKAVSFLFITTLFFGGPASVLFYLGNFITTQVMPETPIEAINILFVIIVVMGVRLGLETLARSAEILFPWFLILFVSLVIFVSPQIKVENLQPMLETGIKSILPATLSFLSITFLPLIVFLMIFPAYVNKSKESKKSFFIGGLIGGLVMIIIIALSISVLGADLTVRQIYPSYALAKKINVGNFLQRIEAIMAGLWFISLYFRLVLYFYAIVLALAQIFNLKDYRPLVLPLGMILVVASLVIYPNVIYTQTWDITTWIPYILTVGAFYPLLLLAIGLFRKKSNPD